MKVKFTAEFETKELNVDEMKPEMAHMFKTDREQFVLSSKLLFRNILVDNFYETKIELTNFEVIE